MQTHLDFKLYLDAATQSVTRTRNTIYLLLTVLVVLSTIYVNTAVLDWSGARLEKMRKALDCVEDQSILQTPGCQEALEYAEALHLPQDIGKPGTVDRYKEQFDAFLRVRTQLRAIQLPIFGSILDLNDLGLVSAILLCILLLILRANFYRELDSLTSAKEKAEEFGMEEKNPLLAKECDEMLTRIQVLASPKEDNRVFRWSSLVVISLTVVVHALILWHDWQTRWIAYSLLGKTAARWFYAIEISGLIFLCLLWYFNTKVWLKLAYLFHEKNPPKWVSYFTDTVGKKAIAEEDKGPPNGVPDQDKK